MSMFNVTVLTVDHIGPKVRGEARTWLPSGV
jgi:hypothetical protein